MPSPTVTRPKYSVSELCGQYYNLQQIKDVIFAGLIYHLDVEAHDDLVNYRRQIYNEQRQIDPNSDNSCICHELYLQAIFNYDLVDIDGKICGLYNIQDKHFVIYLRRLVMPNGDICYCDDELHLWSYSGMFLGTRDEIMVGID